MDVHHRKDNGKKVSGVILNFFELFGFYMRREVLYSYFHFHYFSCSKFLVYLEANEEELAEGIF